MLSNREKAILTYKILQKRKKRRLKQKENMFYDVVNKSVKRCEGQRRKRKI